MLIFCRPSKNQNGLKKSKLAYLHQPKGLQRKSCSVKLIIKLWLSLAPPLPRVLYFTVFYLRFWASQYSSHPPRSCVNPISVRTLLSSPHNALNIEGAYKYCWFVWKSSWMTSAHVDLYLPELLWDLLYPTQLTPSYPWLYLIASTT